MKILVAEPLAAAGIQALKSQPGWDVIVSNPKEYLQHLPEALGPADDVVRVDRGQDGLRVAAVHAADHLGPGAVPAAQQGDGEAHLRVLAAEGVALQDDQARAASHAGRPDHGRHG